MSADPIEVPLIREGSKQYVELPAGYGLPGERAELIRDGEAIKLVPIKLAAENHVLNEGWDRFFESLGSASEDFFADGRQQPPMQERQPL